MILFPAVDIQDGKAVRLKQGRAHESTVFAEDPTDAAKAWEARGAQWLHVVDLDGAFDGAAKSREIVRRICTELSIPVQLGGGIRDMAITHKGAFRHQGGFFAYFAGNALFQRLDATKPPLDGLAGRGILGVSLQFEAKAPLHGHKVAAITILVRQIDQLSLSDRFVLRQGQIAVILHQTRHLRQFQPPQEFPCRSLMTAPHRPAIPAKVRRFSAPGGTLR